MIFKKNNPSKLTGRVFRERETGIEPVQTGHPQSKRKLG